MGKKLGSNLQVFMIFGVLKMLVIGTLIFLVFDALNNIAGSAVIGIDTQIVMTMVAPIAFFVVDFMMYTKK